MKNRFLIAAIVILPVVIVGCSSGPTSQSDINSAAQELQEKAKGAEHFNDGGVVKGGPGGGAMTAPKPHR